MSDLRDAARQALEFCEFLWREVAMNDYAEEQRERIETALKAALEQPEQTCNCRWVGDVQTQQCTLHAAHVDAIHEWAERAKAAEAKLATLEQPEQGGKTGWPPGLLQDDCRGLSKWLASQPDARRRVREAVAALEQPEQEPVDAEAALRFALAQRDWAFKQLQAQPDRREWRSLSEEEIDAIQWHGSPFQFARAIEAALRNKNHE